MKPNNGYYCGKKIVFGKQARNVLAIYFCAKVGLLLQYSACINGILNFF